MKRILSLFMVLSIVFAFASCKQKVVIPDRQAHMNNQSAETFSEYNERVEKEKQEKIDRVKNAQWRNNPEDYKLIALTFDDAPNYNTAQNNNTVTIIDTLNKYEGAGTIFVRGDNIEKNGTVLLSYALEMGFELGNHTYSHEDLTYLDRAEIYEQVKKANDIVYEKFGIRMKYVRPGYGYVNDNVFSVTKELNMTPIWTSDRLLSKDYDNLSTPESVANTIVSGAFDGAIVILHCWPNNTAGAIDDLCKRLYDKGYRFVTLSELFEYKGIKNLPTDCYVYSAQK